MKPVAKAVEMEAGEVAKPTAEIAKRIVKYELPVAIRAAMGKATWKHGQMVWRTLKECLRRNKQIQHRPYPKQRRGELGHRQIVRRQ